MADLISPAILDVGFRAYCRRVRHQFRRAPTKIISEIETISNEDLVQMFMAGRLAEYFEANPIPNLDDDEDDEAGRSRPVRPRPKLFIVIDCECVAPLTRTMSGFETDPRWDWRTQNLLFGVARIGEFGPNGAMRILAEIIFYPDELPSHGVEILQGYFRRRTSAHTAAVECELASYVVGLPEQEADGRIVQRYWKDEPEVAAWLMPLSDFLKEFYRIAYQQRGLVIGFNLPFDLARLGYRWGISKEQRTLGGWSLGLWFYRDQRTGEIRKNMYRPWIRIKKAGPYFSFISFTGCKDNLLEYPDDPDSKIPYRGEFLDLGTLAFAQTARRFSLASAVKTFCNRELDKDVEHGIITPDYIDYGRNDVKATVELAGALLKIFDLHSVSRANGGQLSETKAYSPASFAKAYLQAAGYSVPNVPENRLGPCFAALHGGWTEVALRGKAPVVLLDFKKMYQTLFILQEIQHLFSAERLEFVEDTKALQKFLDEITVNDLFELDPLRKSL